MSLTYLYIDIHVQSWLFSKGCLDLTQIFCLGFYFFFNFSILADYTRYKEKHQGEEEQIEDHEHDSIGQLYFDFYRIAGKACDLLYKLNISMWRRPFLLT